MKRLTLFLFAALLPQLAFSANGIKGKPDDTNYTVDCMDAEAPDHIWLMTEGTGTTTADDCGSVTLTLNTSALWATDAGSGAETLDCEGNSDQADVTSNLGITAFPFTISVLAKFDVKVSGTDHMASLGHATNNVYYSAAYFQNNGRMRVVRQNTVPEADTRDFNTTDYADDTWRWTTVVIVSSTSVNTYVDATATNSDTDQVVFETADSFDVCQRANGSNDFEGQIAAVFVWESDESANIATIFANIATTGFGFINYAPSSISGNPLRGPFGGPNRGPF